MVSRGRGREGEGREEGKGREGEGREEGKGGKALPEEDVGEARRAQRVDLRGKSSILKRGVSEFFGSGPGLLIETCERCENWRRVRKIVNFAPPRHAYPGASRPSLCPMGCAPRGGALLSFFLFRLPFATATLHFSLKSR